MENVKNANIEKFEEAIIKNKNGILNNANPEDLVNYVLDNKCQRHIDFINIIADFEKKRAPAREAGAVFCALPDDFRLQTPKSAGKSGCARGKIMRIFLYTAQKKW